MAERTTLNCILREWEERCLLYSTCPERSKDEIFEHGDKVSSFTRNANFCENVRLRPFHKVSTTALKRIMRNYWRIDVTWPVPCFVFVSGALPGNINLAAEQ